MGSLYPIPAGISLLLAVHGLRKGSLSESGAISAFLVGYGHLANPTKAFGVALIVFYFIGSRATKVKAEIKAKLEDGPDPSKPGGNRNAMQVISNCIPSLLAALYFRFGPLSPSERLTQCPVDGLQKQLIYLALGQLATNFGDTLASELGILSPVRPRYILTARSVPPGTNGAVSTLGLLMSALGGAITSLVMILTLVIERRACKNDLSWAWEMLLFGMGAGFFGSLLDTVLGATLQETMYSTKDKRVLTDHSSRSTKEAGLKKLGFGLNVLSNSGVNFVSGTIMAGLGWLYAA
ncbi:integral membrane protein DUF92-domain-containing protein [Kockovaella imperatae]|uniref:Integral membrane protein DUF92-domain-containing protein n=1 Tax=Kockovaella imperatae TaxID=4999 RepID=A0A1Y1UA64_9TREE|nr:integral membrane protein DUF92-domain-containing protein [Kockovaella imperatae]ORX34407.1 integral membrane protein DUF92-domain-containing protein [Kockovaella imperatae]